MGQGEVTTTPLQVANEMAYIANKGWYYIPHIVDSIEGGDKYGLLDKFRQKITPIQLSDSIFEAVHEGMEGVMESGTGRGSKVEGIRICGKTGTVENYYRGVKQTNHSFFAAFAPREDPKIAIMCVVENSGRYGGTYAAPIVTLLIEKYLHDTLSAQRQAVFERIKNTNLIPPLMKQAMVTRDSLRKVRELEKKEKAEKEATIINQSREKQNQGNDRNPKKDSTPPRSNLPMTTPGNPKLLSPVRVSISR